eukprot:gene10557-10717_t
MQRTILVIYSKWLKPSEFPRKGDPEDNATFVTLTIELIPTSIEYARVFRDDRPLIAITQPFGFGSRGHMDITIKDIGLFKLHDKADTYSPGNFGFFLSSLDQESVLEQDVMAGKCMLDRMLQLVLLHTVANATSHVDIKDGGMFILYFANCERHMPVSFDVRVETFNLVGPNEKKDYLSIGEMELQIMYWAIMYKVIEVHGSAHGWNWVYYIFTFFRGMLFFSVVVLIGTGWSYMRPFIEDRTRKVLMVVVPLQVFANIAIIITSEESRAIRDWLTWRAIFHLVDLICCCAILLPIVWSIKRLRDASHTDGKAARMLEKLTLFRQFYVIVVVFLYFTRIVVYLLENTLENTREYRYQWIAQAINELATLGFYVWVGMKFRPNADNPYTKLHQEEVEMA